MAEPTKSELFIHLAEQRRTEERLAQRLARRAERLAREVDPESNARAEVEWLTFWVSKQLFAIPLAQAQGVVRLDKVIRVPGVPSYLPGIVRVHRRFIVLIDLRELLVSDGPGITDAGKVVAVRVGDRIIGLAVSDLHGVVALAEAQIAAAHLANDGLSRAVTLEGESVALLDLSAMLRDARLTTVLKLERSEARSPSPGG